MEETLTKKLIVLAFVLSAVILAAVVVWPVLISTITGLLLAYIFYPIYRKIFSFVKEKNISALIVVVILLVIIILPVWFLFPIAVRQAFDAYSYSQKVDLAGFARALLPADLSTDSLALLNGFLSHSINSAFTGISNLVLEIPTLMLHAVIVVFIFFFGMRDGEKLKEYVKGVSPFSQVVEKNLSKQFKDITNSVIYGHIIVGVIQGLLTGIGLLIFGVPKSLLLTVFAIFSSILPVVGAWLIWIPASIYLYTSGHQGAAIGLFLYGAIFISWIDNFLRPYIISRRTDISSGVILIGMIGGLIMFGVIGLILGPLILAYFLVILDAYRENKFSELFAK